MLKKVLTAASYIAIGFAWALYLCKFSKPFFLWAIGGVG